MKTEWELGTAGFPFLPAPGYLTIVVSFASMDISLLSVLARAINDGNTGKWYTIAKDFGSGYDKMTLDDASSTSISDIASSYTRPLLVVDDRILLAWVPS